MKILLINPPDRGALDPEMDAPFNLMMIATAMRKIGIEVDIAEWSTQNFDTIDIPHRNIYGITVTTPTYNSSTQIIQRIRNHYPDSKIIVGGAHASQLSVNYADLIVRGHCLNNINKLLHKTGIQTGDASLNDGFPLSWDLIEVDKYIDKRFVPDSSHSFSMISSIGCPMQCRFCYNSFLPNHIEHLSRENFVESIKYLKKHDINGVNFLDDNFILNKSFWTILRELNMYWRAELSIGNSINPIELKQYGCRYVVLGIESGSDNMLKSMNKPQTRQETIRLVSKLTDVGIKVRGLFIVGFPGETWDSVEKTETLIKQLPLDSISIHLFVPFPGTEPFHNPDKYGITWISNDFDKYRTHPVDGILQPTFATHSLSPKTLIEMHSYLESVKSTESL